MVGRASMGVAGWRRRPSIMPAAASERVEAHVEEDSAPRRIEADRALVALVEQVGRGELGGPLLVDRVAPARIENGIAGQPRLGRLVERIEAIAAREDRERRVPCGSE